MQPSTQNPPSAYRKTAKTPIMRLLPLAAAGLALIVLLALAACGGSGDDGDTPPAVTQAPPPADTSATANTGDTSSTQTNAGTPPISGTGVEDLFIISRGFKSFGLNLTAGDTVSVSYEAVGASTGGPSNLSGEGRVTAEVKLTVVDPIEEQIITLDQMQSNTIEFQAELTGTYQLVFANPYLLQALSVTVNYTINP